MLITHSLLVGSPNEFADVVRFAKSQISTLAKTPNPDVASEITKKIIDLTTTPFKPIPQEKEVSFSPTSSLLTHS